MWDRRYPPQRASSISLAMFLSGVPTGSRLSVALHLPAGPIRQSPIRSAASARAATEWPAEGRTTILTPPGFAVLLAPRSRLRLTGVTSGSAAPGTCHDGSRCRARLLGPIRRASANEIFAGSKTLFRVQREKIPSAALNDPTYYKDPKRSAGRSSDARPP